jgi:hypothetical protein
VKTDFKILNRSLCTALDTAYFINTSVVHPATNPNYLWNFGDSLSPASSWLCSTAVSNCNFDTSASVSRHMYEVKSCYNPRLYSYESDYGCIDSTMDTVSRVTTDAIEFKPGGLPCFGKQEVFIIGFVIIYVWPMFISTPILYVMDLMFG